MALYVRQLPLGPMQNFVYLLGAEGAREVAVVDPAWDVPAVLAAAARDGKEVVAALVTHHHFDHVNGLEELLEKRPSVRAYAQAAEVAFADYLRGFGDALSAVGPGDRVDVGPLAVTCVHTPGHTPGAQCFHAGSALFSGDTLFVGACGRCDFPGSSPEQLFDSLHRVLGALPGDTVLYPGHDYGPTPTATLEEEWRTNPYLVRGDLESFVRHRMRPRG